MTKITDNRIDKDINSEPIEFTHRISSFRTLQIITTKTKPVDFENIELLGKVGKYDLFRCYSIHSTTMFYLGHFNSGKIK